MLPPESRCKLPGFATPTPVPTPTPTPEPVAEHLDAKLDSLTSLSGDWNGSKEGDYRFVITLSTPASSASASSSGALLFAPTPGTSTLPFGAFGFNVLFEQDFPYSLEQVEQGSVLIFPKPDSVVSTQKGSIKVTYKTVLKLKEKLVVGLTEKAPHASSFKDVFSKLASSIKSTGFSVDEIEPTPSPSPKPALDIAGLSIVTPLPWTAKEIPETKEESSSEKTPSILKPNADSKISFSAVKGDSCDPVEGVLCASGLSCRPEDPTFPASKTVCQTETEPKKSAPDSKTEEPAPSPEANSDFSKRLLDVDFLSKQAGGKGFGIPQGGFIRDKNDVLYLAYQQPVVKTVSQKYSVPQWHLSTSLAVSKNNGKTWNKVYTQPAPPDAKWIMTQEYWPPPAGPDPYLFNYNNACETDGNGKLRMKPVPDSDLCKDPKQGERIFRTTETIDKSIYTDCDGPWRVPTSYVKGRNPEKFAQFEQDVKTYNDNLKSCLDTKCIKSVPNVCYFGVCSKEYDAYPRIYVCRTWDCECNPPSRDEPLCKREKVYEKDENGNFVPTPSPTPTCKRYKEVIDDKGNRRKTSECELEVPWTATPQPAPSLRGYTTDASYSISVFEGLAPNPKGGAFFYYRIRTTEYTPSKKSKIIGDMIANVSELYLVSVDSEGVPSAPVLLSKKTAYMDPLAYKPWTSYGHDGRNIEMTFLGSSNGRQYFSDGLELFYSEDGGIPRVKQGYLAAKSREVVVDEKPDRCEGNTHAAAYRRTSSPDVTLSLVSTLLSSSTDGTRTSAVTKIFRVAGNRLVILKQLPIVQNPDGYFLSPDVYFAWLEYKLDPEKVLKQRDGALYRDAFESHVNDNLKDEVFNQEFYDRYVVSKSDAIRYDGYELKYGFAKAAVADSDGNLHVVFGYEEQLPGGSYGPDRAINQRISVYYQFFPAAAFDPTLRPKIDSVHFFAKTGCKSCDTVREWLKQSKVPPKESDSPDSSIRSDLRETIVKNLEKNEPVTLIRKKDSDTLIIGTDYLKISAGLGVVLDPFEVDSWKRTRYSFGNIYNNDQLDRIFLANGNTPVIFSRGIQETGQLAQYAYSAGSWKKTSFRVAASSSNSVFSGVSWYKKYNMYGYVSDQFYTWPNHLSQLIFRPMLGLLGGAQFAAVEHASNPDDSAIIVQNRGKTEDGELWPDEAVSWSDTGWSSKITTKTKALKIAYNLLTLEKTEKPDPDWAAGSILSELVPYQRKIEPLTLASATSPYVSLDTPFGAVSVKAVESAEKGAWSYDLVVDTTNYLTGAQLKVPGDEVSGKIVSEYTIDDQVQPVETEFKLPVQHVPAWQLGYAAPEKLAFYTKDGAGPKKKVFLVNNLDKANTFACGKAFSKSVPGKSVSAVDLSPMTASCALAIGGVKNGQTLDFKKEEAGGDAFWSKQDVLAQSAETFEERPLRFQECAGAYCNCAESQAAVNDFESQVVSHASRINAEGSKEAIKYLYGKSGLTEKGLIRTGTFGDLPENSKSACSVFLGGKKWALKPGGVYALSLTVPYSDDVLDLGKTSTGGPVELLPQWTYGTQKGFVQDEKEFTRMIEVR